MVKGFQNDNPFLVLSELKNLKYSMTLYSNVRVLLVGGSGFIGRYLALGLLDKSYEVSILDPYPPPRRLVDKVAYFKGDASLLPHLLTCWKSLGGFDAIINLGAVLSSKAEEDPYGSIAPNFQTTVNVLELSRLTDVKRVVFTSSIASFGGGLKRVEDNTPQRPDTIYGISKVFGELLGLYYSRKYGVDFRAARLPAVIGYGRGPGGASAYASMMVEKPALGEPYKVPVKRDTRMQILYIRDAVNALMYLLETEKAPSRIYNIPGLSPTAYEIAGEVKKHIPQPKIDFSPDPETVRIVESWPLEMDGSRTFNELGWTMTYNLELAVKDFIETARTMRDLATTG
ncbi:NAD-dependent epimerase/dehydratase family protein [Thermoflexus hugenholtzii]